MPDLDVLIIQDLEVRTRRFLDTIGGYEGFEFLSADGSAAVFKVTRKGRLSAFKAFNPEFFSGSYGDAERHRLEVQRRLIGHRCESLIQTYHIAEAEGTAFIEMEFIEWPQLTKCLDKVPDEAIVTLISQLVDAVRFLDSLKIVHRDIKPDNIHVSPDFQHLKLLDLGVVREFDSVDSSDACSTDNGNQRPFLATAQYSSPDYLFRLDEPTSKLWRGLNIYQVGAVLHDLIKKEPLFKHEMSLGNRWLVARAVLTKQPSFEDSVSNRLLALKALASRCLVKDLDTRIALVGWEDFQLEGAVDSVRALRGRLAKGNIAARRRSNESVDARNNFERTELMKRFSDQVRAELIHICGRQLPLTMIYLSPGESTEVKYELTVDQQLSISCHMEFNWQEGLYQSSANLLIGVQIISSVTSEAMPAVLYQVASVVGIQETEGEAITQTVDKLASLISIALDKIEVTVNAASLHGLNIQTPQEVEMR